MSAATALLKQARPHLRNASWTTTEYLFYPLLMLAATPLLVAALGTAQFGLLMLVNSLAGLSAPANFGMSAATIKFVSACAGRRDRTGAVGIVRVTLWLSVAGGAIVALALCAAAPWLMRSVFSRMGDPQHVQAAIYFAAAMLLLMQLDGVFSAALKGLERFSIAARLEIVVRLASVTAAVAVAWIARDILAVLATTIALSLLGTACKYVAVRRALGAGRLWPERGDMALAREVAHFGVWNWLTSIGSMLFVHADRLLIGSLLGAHALAYYSVCVQLAQQVHALPAAAMSVLFPLISRKIHAAEHSSLRQVRDVGIVVNFAVSTVLAAGLLLFGPWLLELWMGAEFAAETGNILRWLTLAYFVLSLNVAPHYLLMGHNEMRYVSVAALAGGGMGVLAALILMPPLGLMGAALARLVLGVTTLANYWKVYRPTATP